jgi:hypothetical protein
MKRRTFLACATMPLTASVTTALAQGTAPPRVADNALAAMRFSTLTVGETIRAPLTHEPLQNIAPNRIRVVQADSATVLQIDSARSASSVTQAVSVKAQPSVMLRFRWKVSRNLTAARFDRRDLDDHAARLYVFFDAPEGNRSVGDRLKRLIGRASSGIPFPDAALCYVWDTTLPINHVGPSPYTDRVQKIVLQTGGDKANQWCEESRNVMADYAPAFGFAKDKPLPRITGLAVAADTDQTGEMVTAWFGDVFLESGA